MAPKSIRPALLVLVALALSATTVLNLAKGAITATDAFLHFAAAILIAWAAVSIVGYLLDNYRASVFRRSQRRGAHRHLPR